MSASDGSYLGHLRFDPEEVPVWARDGTAAWRTLQISIREPGKRQRDIEPALPGRYTLEDTFGLAWSPDSRWLAFDTIRYESSHAEAESGGVWLMRKDGTRVRRVSAGAGPTWSPDGRRLAVENERDHRISIVDVATGKVVRKLSPSPAEVPAWSPRQDLIAFLGKAGIYTMRSDGQMLTLLAGSAAAAYHPAAWSPNGKRLAYEITRGDCSSIVVAAPDGSNRRIYKHRGPIVR